VNEIAALLLIDPDDAASNAIVWRAYDPPVTSVPGAESEPFAVIKANLTGVVTVYADVPTSASSN
jgi:hypothetical protein